MRIRRFFTAGEVDDGKSTLIGRLFHDAGLIRDDLLAQVKDNLAHFTDGLKEERERGITMDVAYRFFETAERKFIVADGPGHLPYIRHMVTAASLADAAVILVDATRGVSLQTKRHAWVANWLGVPSIVFVINKMDAVGYDQVVFERIKSQLPSLASATVIPASALIGDNIVHPSANLTWFTGPTLMQWLEKIPAKMHFSKDIVRFPVQLVDAHSIAGTLASGHLRTGQTLFLGEQPVTLEEVYAHPHLLTDAQPGDALRLKISGKARRGDVLTSEPMRATKKWQAQWLLFAAPKGRVLAQAHHWSGEVLQTKVHRTFDWPSLAWTSSGAAEFPLLQEGEIDLSSPLLDESFSKRTALGQMIWVDEQTGDTIAAVLLEKAL